MTPLDRSMSLLTATIGHAAKSPSKACKVVRLTPRDSRYLHRWLMASGKPIRVANVGPRALSTDWDRDRLRCWSKLTTAQAEVRVAKVMCAVLGCFVVAVAQALVLA
jgi:hypothetical protein